MRTCDRCGKKFKNSYQFGPHRRICNVVRVAMEADVIIDEAPNAPSMRQLAQRTTEVWGTRKLLSEHGPPRDSTQARDYSHMQQTWNSHVEQAHSCCSSQFWRLQEAVLDQTVACKDLVTHAVKRIVSDECRKPAWPESCRALRKRIRRKAGVFWYNVLHK